MPFSQAIRTGRARITVQTDIKHRNRRRYSHIERGFYAPQLERIFRYFTLNQVLFLEHDELQSDLVTTLDQITTFLNVPRFDTQPVNASVQSAVRHFGPQKIEVLVPRDEDLSYLYDLFSDDISATGRFTDLDPSH